MFILEAILTALTKVANESNFDIKKQVWEFAKYLMVDIDLKSYHEMEQKMLSERFYQLSRAVNVEYEFDGWKSWLI
jgi:glycine cleavage system regulatory protein